MKNSYPFIFVLTLLLLTGGCSAYKNISVSDVRLREFTADSAGRILLNIGFTVNNPTKKAITLTKADISAFMKQVPLANGVLAKPVEIPSGGIYTLSGKYAVELDNPLLLLTALISVNLGLLNLFPIPVLDGGAILFCIVEIIVRRPVPEKVQEWSMRIGASLLIALMVFATFNDVMRWFR